MKILQISIRKWFITVFIFLSLLETHFAYASILDQYEIKGRMPNIRTIYMVEPQIILGRRDEKHGLYKGDEPSVKMAQRAILHSAADIFSQQGYGFSSALEGDANIFTSPDYQQKIQSAWTHLDQFADAGKEKKPRLWPFSLAPYQQDLAGNQEVDAIAFVQCYGKFESVATPGAEVPVAAALTVAQLALVGSATITTGDYSTLEFKLSIIDSKTGELIFYRESSEVGTDVRDQARLINTFTSAFKWYVPKAVDPVPVVKFKHKRSEITAQATNGGSNVSKPE